MSIPRVTTLKKRTSSTHQQSFNNLTSLSKIEPFTQFGNSPNQSKIKIRRLRGKGNSMSKISITNLSKIRSEDEKKIEKDICKTMPMKLEEKLNSQIVEFASKSVISYEKFTIFQNMLAEVIQSTPELAKILIQIQKGYSEWIDSLSSELKETNEKLKKTQNVLKEEKEVTKELKKRFKRLAVDHLEVISEMQAKESLNQELNEKLSKITSVGSNEVVLQLKNENGELKNKIFGLQIVVRELKKRLTTFKKVLCVLNTQGVNVKEAFENEITVEEDTQDWLFPFGVSMSELEDESFFSSNDTQNKWREDMNRLEISEKDPSSLDFNDISPVVSNPVDIPWGF